MMKNCIRLIFCFLLLTTVSFLMSCQRTQNASAEEVATRYGGTENPEAVADPAAEADGTVIPGQPSEASEAGATKPQRSSGNRFGFAGAGEGPVKPLRRDTQVHKPEDPAEKRVEKKLETAATDMREEVVQAPPTRAPSVAENKIEAPTPPPAPPEPEAPVPPPPAPTPPASPQIVNLGFAEAIPGDALHVKLPGEFSGLPAISVEKMDVAGNNLGVSYPRGTLMKIPNPKVPGGQIHFKVP